MALHGCAGICSTKLESSSDCGGWTAAESRETMTAPIKASVTDLPSAARAERSPVATNPVESMRGAGGRGRWSDPYLLRSGHARFPAHPTGGTAIHIKMPGRRLHYQGMLIESNVNSKAYAGPARARPSPSVAHVLDEPCLESIGVVAHRDNVFKMVRRVAAWAVLFSRSDVVTTGFVGSVPLRDGLDKRWGSIAYRLGGATRSCERRGGCSYAGPCASPTQQPMVALIPKITVGRLLVSSILATLVFATSS